uniref:Uncharacterized protein n=1 Tax=Panagrellus redivivus TaxID=6233 RepID=A0A7E4ZVV9_PANRE
MPETSLIAAPSDVSFTFFTYKAMWPILFTSPTRASVKNLSKARAGGHRLPYQREGSLFVLFEGPVSSFWTPFRNS